MSSEEHGVVLLSQNTYQPLRHFWLILAVIAAIVIIAVILAGTCCKRGGSFVTGGPYTYLPALHHGSCLLVKTSAPDSRHASSIKLSSADYREYSTVLLQSTRLPVLDYCVISIDNIEIGQRLGGGIFVDTYLSQWKKRRVAAKRLIVGSHCDTQSSNYSSDWIIEEVTYLSQLRHSNLVSVLGLCMNSRQPYVIMEYIEGESMRTLLGIEEISDYPLQQYVKVCIQVAEGMNFLHSANYPILHRDLRCANILVERAKGKAKIVDYGLMRIIQRQRTECNRGSNCYCHPESSALPASIRWTAPEILSSPRADETMITSVNVLTPASDVYSFAMLLWEVVSLADPFCEITDEEEVAELVLREGRPDFDTLQRIIPHFRQLIQTCWDHNPHNRPTFQQLVLQLKSLYVIMSKMSQRRERLNDSFHDSTTTNYLKSALNIAHI